MKLTEQDSRIEKEALSYAKAEKKTIAKELTSLTDFPADKYPVSVFMAGSPGAGKTEASIALIEKLDSSVIRIDPDDLRNRFQSYTGNNSSLFQAATSVLIEKIHDFALNQDQSFLLDGTLSNYEKAKSNIERSLKRKRTVQILYVYQEPHYAWMFVLKRERMEGRRIPIETFIHQYFAARNVVNKLKYEFGKEVRLDLMLKNNDNTNLLYRCGVDQVDYHISERYSQEEVEELVKSITML